MHSFMQEVRNTLDQALELKPGQYIELPFATPRERERWRMTAYRAAQIDKEQSRRLFPGDHMAFDTSRWDHLDIEAVDKVTLRIRQYQPKPRAKILQDDPLQPSVSRTI